PSRRRLPDVAALGGSMGTEAKDTAAAAARPRGSFVWPRLETDDTINRYLKFTSALVYIVAGWPLALCAVPSWLLGLPGKLAVTVPNGVGGGAILAGLGYLLSRHRSRVVAVLLMLVALVQIDATLEAAPRALVLLFGIGSLRATIAWHKRHPATVRWGHVAIATVSAAVTVPVTGVVAANAVWPLSHDQNIPHLVSGCVGILSGIAAASLLTRKFPTTAAATPA